MAKTAIDIVRSLVDLALRGDTKVYVLVGCKLEIAVVEHGTPITESDVRRATAGEPGAANGKGKSNNGKGQGKKSGMPMCLAAKTRSTTTRPGPTGSA